jgi:phosphotransferase system enzyme I (PtsI)
MPREANRERIVEGLGVSPGISIGLVYVFESSGIRVPEYRISDTDVAGEQRRLREAVIRTRRQLGRIRQRLNSRAAMLARVGAEDLGYLLDAYLAMLRDSRLVRGAETRIAENFVNAEAAVQREVQSISEAFNTMHDSYLSARVEDIRDVGNRLLMQLNKRAPQPFLAVPQGSILVADELTPANAAQLDPEMVVGIAAQSGGPQGHTAIMARALGLPAVMGASGLIDAVHTGDPVLIDGDLGQIVINPSPGSVMMFQRRQNERRREEKELQRLQREPAVTQDGVVIRLLANVELPMEMDNVVAAGAVGIGLLRTEFMFLNRTAVPSEDEQYEAIRELVERSDGHPVTVRTLDLGGDKGTPPFLEPIGVSTTSPLGLRGIRLSLARPDLLDTQFRAILRAGAHGPVRILLPMVNTVAEVRAARDLLIRAARRLLRRGSPIPDALPPLGVMIETPAAALSADALAKVGDYFAVGSNDLTMYTLAIDRSDERVAHLYNTLHPGVLRMIEFSAAAARRARIPLSICGEIAGNPRYTALLLGLGFRELSMSAFAIPRVKRRILELDLISAERRARRIMQETDPMRIQILLDEYNTPTPDRDAC